MYTTVEFLNENKGYESECLSCTNEMENFTLSTHKVNALKVKLKIDLTPKNNKSH